MCTENYFFVFMEMETLELFTSDIIRNLDIIFKYMLVPTYILTEKTPKMLKILN